MDGLHLSRIMQNAPHFSIECQCFLASMGNEHEKEEKLQRQNVVKSRPEDTPAAFEHLFRL